jgi:hypothetical protein
MAIAFQYFASCCPGYFYRVGRQVSEGIFQYIVGLLRNALPKLKTELDRKYLLRPRRSAVSTVCSKDMCCTNPFSQNSEPPLAGANDADCGGMAMIVWRQNYP